MTTEPDPTYYGTATFAGRSIELYRAKWKDNRTTFVRWYAKIDGQTENQLHDTRSESPAYAIGMAVLNESANDSLTDRLWGPME